MCKPIHQISSNFTSSDIKILNESTVGVNVNRIKFKAILQEKDVINNNNRTYSEEILKLIVAQLGPKATERKLIAELDHPIIASSDKMVQLKRTATISLKNACVLITKLDYDGRYIVAECETLTTTSGLEVYKLLKDRAVFGFSLRALGSVATNPNGTITVLADGFKAITFDVVANPSHSNAVITQIISESDDYTSTIQNLQDVKNTINEVQINESTFGLIARNSFPELLNEAYFIGSQAKVIDKTISSDALQIICESEGLLPSKDYTIDNSYIDGTIEEAIQYFTKMSTTNNVIGFRW